MTFQVIQMQPRTLSWWRDERADIDLEPIYQRSGGVWAEAQKQYLIDSILNGFDIPKLYVADFTFLNSELNASRKKYAVIDGKQRLLAIYDFFDDKLTLPKGFTFVDDDSLALGGFSYSDLAKNYPKIVRKFDNSSLTVMSVITDDESKINDLFVRLNSSKPLTGAELRNAMSGKLPSIIRDLTAHDFFKTRIKFRVTRGQDKNTAAKLLLLEHRGSIVDTKKQQLDALAREVQEEEALGDVQDDNKESEDIEQALIESVSDTEDINVERSAERVKVVMGDMCNIFTPTDILLRQQSQVPVIYWLVRGQDKALHSKIRPFLLQFQAEREKARDPDRNIALVDFQDYELLARTSNDAYSIRGRVQILEGLFAHFIKAGN